MPVERFCEAERFPVLIEVAVCHLGSCMDTGIGPTRRGNARLIRLKPLQRRLVGFLDGRLPGLPLPARKRAAVAVQKQ